MDLVQEIIYKLSRYKNGLVSESMEQRGICYKRNYGVATHDIKRVVSTYSTNQVLAQQLWDKGYRECMLAAVYLADPKCFDVDLILKWSKQFTNPEIIEQCCMYLLPKCEQMNALLLPWLNSTDIYLQKAAWLCLAKMDSSLWPKQFVPQFKNVLYQLQNVAPHYQASLIYALPLIAQHVQCAQIIQDWCVDQLNTAQHNLITELLAFYPKLAINQQIDE